MRREWNTNYLDSSQGFSHPGVPSSSVNHDGPSSLIRVGMTATVAPNLDALQYQNSA